MLVLDVTLNPSYHNLIRRKRFNRGQSHVGNKFCFNKPNNENHNEYTDNKETHTRKRTNNHVTHLKNTTNSNIA